MGVEYILVRDDNKEIFELGKRPIGLSWYDLEEAFDAKEFDFILSHWNPIKRFKITDLEFLKEYMLEGFESDIIEYWISVLEDIYKWSNDEYVYIGHDEIEFELKTYDYKVTGSRYKK